MSGGVNTGADDGTATASAPRRALIAGRLVARAAPGTLALYALPALATGALPVATAWSTKLVIDRIVAGGGRAELLLPALALVTAGLVAGVTPHLVRYLRTELDRRVGLYAQDRLFRAVDRFVGLGRFENPRFLDRLRLAQQTDVASPAAAQAVDGLLGIARSAFTIAGFVGSLSLISPLMTALVLVAGAPALAAEITLSRRRARTVWDIGPAERREFFYQGLLTSVEAAKEIRLFGTGAFLRGRMLADRRTAISARRALDLREVRVQAGLGLLAALVSGAGLLWAVGAAGAGELTPGDVAVFIAAVVGVQGAVTTLANDVAGVHQSLLLFDHYVAVTGAGPELPTADTPLPLPRLRRGIELRDVWFRYSPDHPWVLRGVDLFVPHGTSVGLVGLNGSGKSTLVKLLCRFYDPTRGAILWDGVDIRHVDVAELRRNISAVFQDYMDYDMTVSENIAQGDLDALGDPGRIRTAARRAGVDDTLAALPHGYDTLLSRIFFMESDKDDPATGVLLSGGQCQRLALARAFLRDRRDLMILDEPSAGLDAAAEYEVHSSLRRYRAGRTSLLVSHRLGALRDVDTLVVLSGGRVAEQGDHAALMAAEGVYARLFTLQASGYRAGDGPGAPSALKDVR
ncbi:ABC transporter ATP-binding protein [Streptomyces cinnamoneus]|uniref:ABC transporter ATP-binding protein n=1 Tax=Streptomyces cinnamoneus TaxID=53446 RepID=UPI00167F077D